MNQSATKMRRGADLFLISFAVLYLELAAIRWFPAYAYSLTFFTNFVLLGAFVGMSVGCLATNHRWRVFDHIPSLIAVTLGATLTFYASVGSFTSVQVGDVNRPELVYFGVETFRSPTAKLIVQSEVVGGALFLMLALWFVGLGQVLGRKLSDVNERILAYAINVAGSLVGIAAFAATSCLELPPGFWFAVAFGCVAYFLWESGRLSVSNATLLACAVGAVTVAGWRMGKTTFFWTPYYAVRFNSSDGVISVNGIAHQMMMSRTQGGAAYELPYVMRRDAGLPATEDVLIIGAGSGNDVSHALDHGVRHIDAVEIDPVIARLGREHHPDRPYNDGRVRLVVDDGRGFLHRSDRKYDVIVYAVVDSLTLHSSYSSVRLESFLFTEEAFADIRRHLKPGGIFVTYNNFRQGWIVARIANMMRRAFDCEPLVFSLPPRPTISDMASEETAMAALFAGPADSIGPLREKFAESGGYTFFAADSKRHHEANGFVPGRAPEDSDAFRLIPARLIQSREWKLPTDDWPFLYLRDPRIPSHNWRMLGVMLTLSLGLLVVFAPGGSLRVDLHFFFLGAGFMLIETKSVIQAAQLFGSTWLVNSVVFAGVLVMILLANVYVVWVRPKRLLPYFVALALSLVVSTLVPLEAMLSASPSIRAVESTSVMFAPILFAGIIFATSFRGSPSAELAFGSNIAGVVFGGLLEYLSLVIGYQYLMLIAAAFYALSMIRRPLLPAGPR